MYYEFDPVNNTAPVAPQVQEQYYMVQGADGQVYYYTVPATSSTTTSSRLYVN